MLPLSPFNLYCLLPATRTACFRRVLCNLTSHLSFITYTDIANNSSCLKDVRYNQYHFTI